MGSSPAAKTATSSTAYAKATVTNSRDLSSSTNFLRSQITSATGAPSCRTVHDGFGDNRVELRNLNASTAFAGIEKSVTNNSARLDEQAALFNSLRHIGAEIIPFYDVRQKDTAGIILKWCAISYSGLRFAGLKSRTRSGVPPGLFTCLSLEHGCKIGVGNFKAICFVRLILPSAQGVSDSCSSCSAGCRQHPCQLDYSV